MASELPKVLHPVLFQPMLHHVLDLARAVPHASISVIVGHGAEAVRKSCERYPGVGFFVQAQQRGTADAVRAAESFLGQQTGTVLVLSGDVPLLRQESVEKLVVTQAEAQAAAVLLTARLSQPKGYGRILRDQRGRLLGIREEADCNGNERAIDEVNAGIYCFRLEELWPILSRIGDGNRQKEYYLTDAIALLAAGNRRVEGIPLDDPTEMMGINDRIALAQVESALQERVNRAWMLRGVTIESPATVFIDTRSQLLPDSRIEGGCRILRTSIAARTVVEAGCRLIDSRVGEGCTIKQGSYLESAEVGPRTSVGPYAHLRPGTVLAEDVKIGNFVEVKKSTLGPGTKASHLAYIGDAQVGRDVNLGCGFITCNLGIGPGKNRTVIEDRVFIGSDSQAVAPVRIGSGSVVAAGTTVTEDVPPDSLVLSRGRQVTKPGYAEKLRQKE